MSLFSCRLPLWLAAGLIASSCVYAADKCKDAKVKCEGSEFQLFIENDMLAHTDRYYTNGIKIGIGVPGDTLEELLRGFSTLAILPFPKKEELHFGWFIGQNLYTPKKISVPAAQPFDRPDRPFRAVAVPVWVKETAGCGSTLSGMNDAARVEAARHGVTLSEVGFIDPPGRPARLVAHLFNT